MPLFNKFEPLSSSHPISQSIHSFSTLVKFPLDQIYVKDESKNSKHVNAFYFGFGLTKKIVLYDNMLNGDFTNEEIMAVVVHEIGHWDHMHPL